MHEFVTFLRGVNIGGRSVKSAKLKLCLEVLGFSEVKAYLQTGNIKFKTNENRTKLKSIIETAIEKEFGFNVKALVYNLEDLHRVVADFPFKTKDGIHSYVVFVENSLERQIVSNDYGLAENESVQPGEGVIYWQVPIGSTLKSQFNKCLNKSKYKDFNSVRNLNTLQKMTS